MLHDPEHMLWSKVLLLAVEDAKRGDPEAAAWFHTADARRVASFAGVNPDSFSRIVRGVDWAALVKPPRRRRRRSVS